jgi:ssDNA thymidine ADP-ribosyltransferase, DarT
VQLVTTLKRGLLYHFTHVSNLASIAEHGIFCDSTIGVSGRLTTDVGQQGIKAARRLRQVPIEPGGVVADYVPFYFAARSPMLGSIHMGRVPSYSAGQEEIVYLVTDIDRVVESGSDFVFTDRNARSAFAQFENDLSQVGALIDWPLMEGRMWNDTAEEPDRMERRMAEFLVHRHVAWDLIIGMAAIDEGRCREAEALLATMGVTTAVRPRQDWYF